MRVTAATCLLGVLDIVLHSLNVGQLLIEGDHHGDDLMNKLGRRSSNLTTCCWT